jgi:hypothetical protein
MASEHQAVLFFVFVGFFILIGLASLSVLLGFCKTADRRFRQWALFGFFAGVSTAIFGLFKILFITQIAPVVVILQPPVGISPPVLKGGTYQYDEIVAKADSVVTRTGRVFPVVGEGNWQVQLPGEVSNKPMRLHLEDENGNWWETSPFFPNYIRQEMRTGKALVPESHNSWQPPGVALLLAAEMNGAQGASEQSTVKFNNYARKRPGGSEPAYYDWRIFVDEPPAVLNTIDQIDYVLHPTFPQPFQTSRNRNNAFELVNSGWGGFNILITVHYTNGRQAKTSYLLDLRKDWPTESRNTATGAGR